MTNQDCLSINLRSINNPTYKFLLFLRNQLRFTGTISASVAIPLRGCSFDWNRLNKCKFVRRTAQFFSAQKLVVEIFSQSYVNLKQRNISETTIFFFSVWFQKY